MTRVLSIAGAKLPATLLGAGRGNEAGHWESEALAAYNDQFLALLDSRWWDWRALELGRHPANSRREIKSEMGNVLASEFGDARLFVVKDPRICRFAPLFLEVLDDMGIEARVVKIVRNPLEVADSLERRDGLLRVEGALQWLRHVLDGEVGTRARARVIVSYSALLKDGRATLAKITDALHVSWPYSIDEVGDQVEQFLDHSHRHHARTVEDVLLDPAIRGWVGEAYSALLVLEQNPASKAAMTALDTIRQEFNHAAPVVQAMLAESRAAWDKQHAGVLAEREQETARLRVELGSVETGAAQFAQEIETRAKEAVRLKAASDEADARAAQLAKELEARHEEEARLKATLVSADTRARELSQEVEARAKEEVRLKATSDEADARAVLLAKELEARREEEARLRAVLARSEARAGELSQEVEARAKEEVRLKAASEEADARAAKLAKELETRHEEEARLRAALASYEARAGELSQEVEARAKEAVRLKAASDEADVRAVQLAQALKDSEKREARQGAELSEAQAEVARMSGEVEQCGRQASRHDAALAEISVEVQRSSAALAAMGEEGARLRTALAETRRDAVEMRSIVEMQEKKVRRLEAEKTALLQEWSLSRQDLIEHFRSSTSWKVTRPIRALKDLVPRLGALPRLPKRRVGGRRGSSDAAIIAQSGLFDELYYMSLVGDHGVTDPIEHYLQHGHKMGLEPSPLFDTDYYTTLYAAELDQSINPFVHFIQQGCAKGFNPCRLFQSAFYRDTNTELGGSGISPLQHYLRLGRVQGRMPIHLAPEELDPLALQLHRLDLADADSNQFNPVLYAGLYPDIAESVDSDERALLNDYNTSGRAEGRIGSLRAFLKALKMPPEAVPIDFSCAEYYELNADLGAAFPHTFFHAIRHYLEFGIRERRRYSYAQCYIDGPWHNVAQPKSAREREDPAPAAAAGFREAANEQRIACLVNLRDRKAWPGVVCYLSALDCVERDLVVCIDDKNWTEGAHAQIKEDFADASIVITQNSADNILDCIDGLVGMALDAYAAVVLVKAGQSECDGQADERLDRMLGSSEAVHDNLALLMSDPGIGVIVAGPDEQCSEPGMNGADNHQIGLAGPALIMRPRLAKRLYEELRAEELNSAGTEYADLDRSTNAAARLLYRVGRSLGYRVQVR